MVSGLPGDGAASREPGSRLDRAGCSGLAVFYRKPKALGRLHRMGWGGWGRLGLTELSNQRAAIFRVRRPRPKAVGGLCFDATAQATLPVHGTRPAGRGEIFPTRPATLPCVDSNPPWSRTPCRVLSPSGPRGAEPAIRLMQVSLASMAATVKLTSRI